MDFNEVILPRISADGVCRGECQAARLQVYEAALQRIAARTEYGDAMVREVGLKTASDIAAEALAWKK